MTSVDAPIKPRSRGGPSRPRAPWHLRANAVVVCWLGLTVVAALAQEGLPAPRWLLIHVFLLGAVSNAILIWTEHFAVTLLHAREPDPRRSLIRLGTLNVGALAVQYGTAVGPWQVAAAGAGAVVAAVGWHAAALAGMARRALPGQFGHVVPWYVAASGTLAVGGTLGGLLVAHVGSGTLHAAHAQVNLFGWVGLTVLGTLFTLWPTILRTRMSALTRRASRAALRLAVPGLTLATGGLLLGMRWLAVLGLAVYAAAVVVALAPLADTVRRRRPHTPAAWMLAAAVVWFQVALVVDLVITFTRPPGEVADALEPLLPLVLVGFVAQTLIGSLVHLLPVVLGGGPARLKENSALLERGWTVRFAMVNLAVPLLALPVPPQVRLLGWAALLGAATAFVALALAALTRERLRTPVASPALAGVVAGCVLTGAAIVVADYDGSAPSMTVTASGAQQTVEVTLIGMRIQPGVIEAAPGTRLTLHVTNNDAQRHDLRLSTGERTPLLGPGESARLEVGVLAGAVDGWCTVAGHSAAGMTMRIVPKGVAAASDPGSHAAHTASAGESLDLAASMSPGWKPYDATLQPAPQEKEHQVEIRVQETDLEVAPGVRQRMWTFNGTVPGPVLRGRVGDVFTVTFVNDGTMGHGIDFHAGALAPDQPMRTIQPGQRLTYRFRADFAGAWLYHCSTMPMSQHIANGMYGAVVIDPPDLPRVNREYLLVQSELYLGQPGSQAQVAKMRQGRPDGWMFDGTVAGYDHAPLPAKARERVRIWMVAAGPDSGTAFHVVGAPFDTVYKEGAYLLREHDPGGAQVLDLAPAQGGFVELEFPEPGHYPLVDHSMRHAEAGAHGMFAVGAP
ncbi:multicopper oxidase domain-containing protein [Acrocarpospora sp. B8E8]|uniref:multicopper oxidase domain-containing protein n=1 Tax=Acrocarpospora sp. B8E8 TaxID=3153572 RepID=UPI00325D2C46